VEGKVKDDPPLGLYKTPKKKIKNKNPSIILNG
jgi:hypothetical protein